jgi:hypothetical protein
LVAEEPVAPGGGLVAALLEEGVVDGVGDGPKRDVVAEIVAPVGTVVRAYWEGGGDAGAQAAEEEAFQESFGAAAGAVGEPGIGAEKHRDAEELGGEDGVERVRGGIAVNPEGVEGRGVAVAAQPAEDAVVEGDGAAPGEKGDGGKEFVGVTLNEGDVPLHIGAEAVVVVGAEGEVRAEENGEVDAWLAGEAAEQGSLVLDGVADQVGQAKGAGYRGDGHIQYLAAIRRMETTFSTTPTPPELMAALAALVGR